jgi:UPF0042 nucleotide-binding protein
MTGATPPHLVVITGMSGAGRSLASKALEDLGFIVIDNLPADLINAVVNRMDMGESTRRRVAVVVDTRRGLDFAELDFVMRRLAADGIPTTLLFLDAEDSVLERRYEENRRPHPVEAPTIADSISLERTALEDLRERADVIIDTSDRSVHDLREAIEDAFSDPGEDRPLRIAVRSFGFKHGMPRVVDLLFDVRFLPNPHWDPELRPLTGLDDKVRQTVLGDRGAEEFLDKAVEMLEFLIPRYAEEGKSYLTIGVGCTGGRHRSVAIAEEIARRLHGSDGIEITTRHRDIDR